MKKLFLATALFAFGVAIETHAEEMPKLQLKMTGSQTMSIDGTKMGMDYKEPVPVKDLIKAMAQASGKNVILDRSAADAKAAVSFPEPLPNAEAFAAIVTALESQGLQVNDDGQAIRVSR